MNDKGYSGRGRRAVSAQIPKMPIMAMVRMAVGMLRSWLRAMVVNPRSAITVGR